MLENDSDVKVFHLAQTTMDWSGLSDYLAYVGAKDWKTSSPSDAECLVEVAGRTDYKSWFPGLNPNVTRIRQGNDIYIKNILNQEHGSVLECVWDVFVIIGTRIMTHEVVRHRSGTFFSQESMRFVRLDNGMRMYYPDVFKNLPEAKRIKVRNLWEDKITSDIRLQLELAQILELDTPETNFEYKKKLTSAMRRLAPSGFMTKLVMGSNARNWRWLIEMRTSRHAEEEIRKVFGLIYRDLKGRYPNIYQDAKVSIVDGIEEISFANKKI